ncbi:MAG: glycosyltransferase [Anaerolineaceae bacterium]
MKIACITTSQIPSTTANSIQVMKVCQSLEQNGCQISLWVPGQQATPWKKLADHYGVENRFELHWLRSNRVIRRYDFAWKSVSQAKKWGAEAVYTWTPQAALIALRRGLSVIMELHDRPSGKLGPALYRKIFDHPGKKLFLPITLALKQVFETEFNLQFKPNEYIIAPDGVDFERYANLPDPSKARTELGIADRFTAGYTGHFYEGRGMDLLFDLAKSFPQVQFLWIGGKPADVEAWQQKARAESLDHLVMTGFVPNVFIPKYQAAAEILLMPYQKFIAGSSGGNTVDICSPMKMFEYMATGRAIITSDLPVLREVLDESSARFCPVDDLDQWHLAIRDLLDQPEKRMQIGINALGKVEQYSWFNRSKRILNAFEEV